jgi:hypothetical protein
VGLKIGVQIKKRRAKRGVFIGTIFGIGFAKKSSRSPRRKSVKRDACFAFQPYAICTS